MSDPSKFARERLLAACQAKNKTRRTAWILLIGASVLLLLVFIAWIDYRFVLPEIVRIGGGFLIFSLIAIGARGLIKLLRRPASLKEAALDAEAQRPELGCVISTAAEYLGGERTSTHEYEPELVAALENQAAKSLEKIEISYGRQLFWPAGFLAAALIAFLLFVFLAPGASTALSRAAFPWTKTAYTKIDVKPGNLEIPVGRDLDIVSAFLGRPPKQPEIQWRNEANGSWQTAALTKSPDGTFVHSLKNLHAPLQYRVTGGDAVSDTFEIKTYVPPEIRDLRVQIVHPEYTQLKPVEQPSPEITAVRGSKAGFKIVSSVKLAKARLRFTGLPPVDLVSGENNLWNGNLEISKDTDYWIELTDEKGRKGENEKPFHIKALPDEAPKIEIVQPGQDIRAAATNRVPLKISVTDDFGVGEVKVVYHTLGGPEHFLYCNGKKTESGEVIADAEIELAGLWLKDYQLVAYHAEAKDNNTLDGPGIGKSPVYFIEITNEEDGDCKSQCVGAKVNLLTIQKQIIAETAALSANAPSEKFKELSVREKDAVDFAEIYIEALTGLGAPAEVMDEMKAAIGDLERAIVSLDNRQRNAALPDEESALAHFYQVLKLMPELKDLPTKPPTLAEKKPPPSPKLQVVLEAIKKKKKEQPSNKEIAQALQEAKRLNLEQARVNSACEKPGDGGGQSQAKNPGEDSKPGNKSADEKKADQKLAQQQEKLSKEAKELAEKLKRLGDKDSRLGHNVSLTVSDAAKKMENAAQALKEGNSGGNGNGLKSAAQLSKVVAYLERLLKDEANLTDVADEEFPKEYETLIAEYLKKLSYEE